jgi:3-oxoadipate enol-lactonase
MGKRRKLLWQRWGASKYHRLCAVYPAPELPNGFIRQANACIGHDSSLLCKTIKSPALVLVGAQERVFSVPEVLALSLQIPNARYQCFDKGGHNLWMEYPEDVAKAIIDFVG